LSRPLLAAVLLAVLAGPARAVLLADSTTAQSWTLGNGLEVRTREISGVPGIAVTLAFRAGSGYEPAGREGLADLLAELEFMGPAGGVPERTSAEMTSLRPLGWETFANERAVRFTEVATAAQLPGVLQQFAARLAGIDVTDAVLKTALAQVRREAGMRLFGDPAGALYWRVAALARGDSDDRLLRRASMPGLDKLTPREVTDRIAGWYQPGNASLALVGDFGGQDVHAIVASLFGKLPGRPGLPDTVTAAIRGTKRVTSWKGLTAPIAVVATASPSLADTLHPGFFLSMLITAAGLNQAWGKPPEPLRTRFQYSVIDDADLVRFYPPVPKDATDPAVPATALGDQLGELSSQMVTGSIFNTVKKSVRWLLGGELTDDVKRQFHASPAAMGTLSNGMAMRALCRGDAFWALYLRRFDRMSLGQNYYYDWLEQPEHQAVLLLTPGK
jgi:hypothetical protein